MIKQYQWVLVFMAICLSGCMPVSVGIGVTRAVVVSSDSVEVAADASFEHAWNITHITLSNTGYLYEEDRQMGEMTAEIDGANVVATVRQLTPNTVVIRVSARRYLVPHLALAETIGNDIKNAL